jgi:hypothetical protein
MICEKARLRGKKSIYKKGFKQTDVFLMFARFAEASMFASASVASGGGKS